MTQIVAVEPFWEGHIGYGPDVNVRIEFFQVEHMSCPIGGAMWSIRSCGSFQFFQRRYDDDAYQTILTCGRCRRDNDDVFVADRCAGTTPTRRQLG